MKDQNTRWCLNMCGIAGFIGSSEPDKGRIRTTLERMKNRGPDVQSYKIIKDGTTSIALLHSRLSIIDLDERSNQPFVIGDYSLVFNGEIYNYVELKKNLEQSGIQFKTTSDTEVLLQSYILKGEKCLEEFEGMWSFALYDGKRKKLLLSRDRFAEKPLYYYETTDGIYFGSEIKFLDALSGRAFDINEKHLFRYLVNGFKSLYKTSETFFSQVRELPYASLLTIDLELKKDLKRYWHPSAQEVSMTFDQAVEGFREKLFESLKIRLRADTPIAFCLSGGVDSASLASIAVKKFNQPISTFSIIEEDERYNELDNIQATVKDLGCKSTLIHVSKDGTLERLRKLIEYHDSPLATVSYYVHSFLSESIAKQGFRVAISGTGADELITGYYDHFNLHLYEMKNHKDYSQCLSAWEKHIKPLVRNPYLQMPDLYHRSQEARKHLYFRNDEFASYLKHDFNEEFAEETFTPRLMKNRMMNELFHEIVPVILHEDDLNSMFYSIENRSPYLDSRLMSFAYSIPPEHLIKDAYGKSVLRESVKGILNDKVRLDRQKKGFNASLTSLVDFNDKKVRESLLDNGPVFDYLDRIQVERLFSLNPMPNSYSKFLFNFLNVKFFLEAKKAASHVKA